MKLDPRELALAALMSSKSGNSSANIPVLPNIHPPQNPFKIIVTRTIHECGPSFCRYRGESLHFDITVSMYED